MEKNILRLEINQLHLFVNYMYVMLDLGVLETSLVFCTWTNGKPYLEYVNFVNVNIYFLVFIGGFIYIFHWHAKNYFLETEISNSNLGPWAFLWMTHQKLFYHHWNQMQRANFKSSSLNRREQFKIFDVWFLNLGAIWRKSKEKYVFLHFHHSW